MIIIDLANHAKTDFSYWKKGGSYKLNFAEGDFVVVTLDFQLSFRIKLHIFLTFFVVLGIFRVWLDYVKILL